MDCFLFGAGEYFGLPLRPSADDLCLAVDGGIAHLSAEGLTPDALIGDFDSGSIPDGIACPILRYPVEKDETDMQLALSHAIKSGAERCFLLGGTGGRLDHTLANLACLANLAHLGKRAYLFGDGFVLLALKNAALSIPDDIPFPLSSGTASVFAFGGDAKGVTITGMKYQAHGITLLSHVPTGVSNEYSPEQGARISVEDGMLLILLPI